MKRRLAKDSDHLCDGAWVRCISHEEHIIAVREQVEYVNHGKVGHEVANRPKGRESGGSHATSDGQEEDSKDFPTVLDVKHKEFDVGKSIVDIGGDKGLDGPCQCPEVKDFIEFFIGSEEKDYAKEIADVT